MESYESNTIMKKILSLVSFAWLFIAGANAEEISVQDISLNAGETKTVNIYLTNTYSNYVGFQMDLALPNDISINKSGCSLSNRFNDPDQTLTIGKQGDNVYRLIYSSFALKPFSGTSGILLTISLTASGESHPGWTRVSPATIENIILATKDSGTFHLDDEIFYITVVGGTSSLGDVNGDGSVGAADVSAMINYILKRPNSAFIFKNADMNSDGTISATDVSALINVILHKN